jgi:hypothetical protein
MAKMTTEKECFLSHKNAQKTAQKAPLSKQAFIDNCLIIMGLQQF